MPHGQPGDLADTPPPYAAVYLDCDSTLSTLEGIDELAAGADAAARAALEAMTAAAMAGEVPLESVYAARLEQLRPDRADLDRIAARYVETAVAGGPALVAALQARGKRVGVVSGGLRGPVTALATHLGIAPSDVHAVDVHLDADGRYAGFDDASPLARSGGKIDVLRALAAEHGPLAFVGDGATDLEAAPVVARFVAFAGVVARPAVVAAARHAVTTPDLTALLPLLLTEAEQADA